MAKNEVLTQENAAVHSGIGEHIGFELGAKLVKNYADTHGSIVTHFVGRNILEKILAQPDCVGVSVFRAIDENNKDTYVLVGVDNSGKNILQVTEVNVSGELNIKEGIVADRVKDNGGGILPNWFAD